LRILRFEGIPDSDDDMRRATRQKLEVGDGSLLEFEDVEKGQKRMEAWRGSERAKPKLLPTEFDDDGDSTCYKQNTSRRRCRKEESVVVSSSTPASPEEIVESVGKLEQDWWKLLELLGTLIFETIGLVLLIGIIVVRQGKSWI
jgi:hypothetical protein